MPVKNITSLHIKCLYRHALPLGGLEMFVDGELVGRTLIAVTENKRGSTKFTPHSSHYKINGKEPPVITLGEYYIFFLDNYLL